MSVGPQSDRIVIHVNKVRWFELEWSPSVQGFECLVTKECKSLMCLEGLGGMVLLKYVWPLREV